MCTELEVIPEDIYWAFQDSPEVQDLYRQLSEGLIHPIEYSSRILALAKDCNLPIV